jgi:predicted small lipoprotein YifL
MAMKYLLVLMTLVLVLAACGTPPATTTNPAATTSGESAPTQEGGIDVSGDPGTGFGFGDMLEGEGFAAVVTGDNVALEFNDAGYYGCENGNTYAIRPANGSLPQLTIIVPADTAAGTYTLGDRNVTAMVVTADNQVYAGILDGILVLDSIATAANQQVKGSFDFSATNGSNTVAAQGEFDFMPASDIVFCG